MSGQPMLQKWPNDGSSHKFLGSTAKSTPWPGEHGPFRPGVTREKRADGMRRLKIDAGLVCNGEGGGHDPRLEDNLELRRPR
jgi:hypothetical protein